MQTYDQLVEIARICLRQARMAGAAEVVKELRRMAWEYREKAAKLNGGKLPDLGEYTDDKPIV
jgi:hypothetical protein